MITPAMEPIGRRLRSTGLGHSLHDALIANGGRLERVDVGAYLTELWGVDSVTADHLLFMEHVLGRVDATWTDDGRCTAVALPGEDRP